MWLEEGINHQILGVKGLIQCQGFLYLIAQERCVDISMQ